MPVGGDVRVRDGQGLGTAGRGGRLRCRGSPCGGGPVGAGAGQPSGDGGDADAVVAGHGGQRDALGAQLERVSGPLVDVRPVTEVGGLVGGEVGAGLLGGRGAGRSAATSPSALAVGAAAVVADALHDRGLPGLAAVGAEPPHAALGAGPHPIQAQSVEGGVPLGSEVWAVGGEGFGDDVGVAGPAHAGGVGDAAGDGRLPRLTARRAGPPVTARGAGGHLVDRERVQRGVPLGGEVGVGVGQGAGLAAAAGLEVGAGGQGSGAAFGELVGVEGPAAGHGGLADVQDAGDVARVDAGGLEAADDGPGVGEAGGEEFFGLGRGESAPAGRGFTARQDAEPAASAGLGAGDAGGGDDCAAHGAGVRLAPVGGAVVAGCLGGGLFVGAAAGEGLIGAGVGCGDGVAGGFEALPPGSADAGFGGFGLGS